jgi:hypothetical protein
MEYDAAGDAIVAENNEDRVLLSGDMVAFEQDPNAFMCFRGCVSARVRTGSCDIFHAQWRLCL